MDIFYRVLADTCFTVVSFQHNETASTLRTYASTDIDEAIAKSIYDSSPLFSTGLWACVANDQGSLDLISKVASWQSGTHINLENAEIITE